MQHLPFSFLYPCRIALKIIILCHRSIRKLRTVGNDKTPPPGPYGTWVMAGFCLVRYLFIRKVLTVKIP